MAIAKIISKVSVGLLAALLLNACAEGGKTNWPTGRKKDGDNASAEEFKATTCVNRIEQTRATKKASRDSAITGEPTIVCVYTSEDKPVGDVTTSAMAYGEDDYISYAITPSFRLAKTASARDFVLRYTLELPEKTSAEAKAFISDTIEKVCLPQINEVWRKSESKMGIQLRQNKAVDSVTGEASSDGHKLRMAARPGGKPGEFALALWPFHSDLIPKVGTKDAVTEPFCRSFAKLTALWLGVKDNAAPESVGQPCPQPENDVHPEADSLIAGYNKSTIKSETEDDNFWTRATAKDTREIQQILQDQCKVELRTNTKFRGSKSKSASGTRQALPTTSAATPEASAADLNLDTAAE